MTRPVLNVADAPVDSESHGDNFQFTMSELAGEIGAQRIGANVTRVPPGKAAFPLHHHYANEEHFFVLSGTGVLRVGESRYSIKPQDYIVNLPGDPDTAHQMINTGAEELVYLAISSMRVPEVVGYPESGKTGVRAESFEAESGRFLILDGSKNEAGYWDGEDGATVATIVSHAADKG